MNLQAGILNTSKILIALASALVVACGHHCSTTPPAETVVSPSVDETQTSVFTEADLEVITPPKATKRMYLIHGLCSTRFFYSDGAYSAYKQALNAKGFETVAMTLPCFHREDMLDDGAQHRAQYLETMKTLMKRIDATFGLKEDFVTGCSFGGLNSLILQSETQHFHAVITFMSMITPSTHEWFKGLTTSHFDAMNEVQNLGSRPMLMLWGDADPIIGQSTEASFFQQLQSVNPQASNQVFSGLGHSFESAAQVQVAIDWLTAHSY